MKIKTAKEVYDKYVNNLDDLWELQDMVEFLLHRVLPSTLEEFTATFGKLPESYQD